MENSCNHNLNEMNPENGEINPSQMPPFQNLAILPQAGMNPSTPPAGINPLPLPIRNEHPNTERNRIDETIRMCEQAEKIMKSLQTPQAVRELQPFDGNPYKLSGFIQSVENLIPFMTPIKGTPIEKIWLQAIRAKIINEADHALETHGTPLDWESMKDTLRAYFNDKRSPVTLTRELFQTQQTTSIEDFFGQIQNLLSLLINHTNMLTENENVKQDKISTHRENALQVFLAGLNEPIGGNVRARQPKNIKQAFDAAIEERSFQNRVGLNRPNFIPRPPGQFKPFQQPLNFPTQPFNYSPQYQPRRTAPYNQQFYPRQQNYFQSPSTSRQNFTPRFSNQQQSHFMNNRQQQKPLPLPEPMETDRSIRSKNVNYMNRPQNNNDTRFSQRTRFVPAVPPRPARITELRNIEQTQEGSQELYDEQSHPSMGYNYEYYQESMGEYSEEYHESEQEITNEDTEITNCNQPADNLNFQLEPMKYYQR